MGEGQVLAAQQILVVEDNYILAMDICEWLQAAGAAVVGPVPDVAQAVDKMDSLALSAAVIDINLGAGPTFEIADTLAGRKVPFLFATGYDRSAIPERYASAPCIEKPFNGMELVSAVARLGRTAAPLVDMMSFEPSSH